jgi:glycosyltransferase involved in cell wall biosynthesis
MELPIIIPTNNSKYLQPLLDSIVDQEYIPDHEIIIGVDGCEKALQDALVLQDEYDLKIFFCKKNIGVYQTLNALLDVAKGNEIFISGSDDICTTDMFEEIYKYGNDIRRFKYVYLKDEELYANPYPRYAAGCFWMRKSVLTSCGYFKPWRYSADSEFQERAKSAGIVTDFIDKELLIYRIHPENLTHTVKITDRIKQRNKLKLNGHTASIWH